MANSNDKILNLEEPEDKNKLGRKPGPVSPRLERIADEEAAKGLERQQSTESGPIVHSDGHGSPVPQSDE